MKHTSIILLGAALCAAAAPAPGAGPGPGRHVVVIVFDGMRPDFVSPETTPNLCRMAARGVLFAHHHPVYLSSTEVNGTAIATGAYPSRSTVISNVDFRPSIDPQKPVGIEGPATVRRGDLVSGGRYLGAPTVAEILHSRGRRTVIAGTKQVALLFDRAERADAAVASPVLFEGATLPVSLGGAVTGALGAFPPVSRGRDKMDRDAWTTSAVIGPLWKDGVPDYTLLWLAEPDFSQHATGPGSAQALAVIRNSDAQLGRVLAELERRGLSEQTDVFVVSDHGFSTIAWKVDVATELSAAGFRTERAALGGLRDGDVLVVGCGGSSLLYVGGRDPDVCRRLAAYIQIQDWAGVVFSRLPLEGTFPLSEARIDSPGAPDLVVSLHWTSGRSATGAPGLQTTDGTAALKSLGNHASLSPFDMHNTLVAAGPDLRSGVVDTLPTGNVDVAPTVLWLLGLRDEAARMDGRVLGEALAAGAPALRGYEIRRLTASRAAAGGVWEQYLQVSEVNGVRYLDEGNGAFVAGSR